VQIAFDRFILACVDGTQLFAIEQGSPPRAIDLPKEVDERDRLNLDPDLLVYGSVVGRPIL
jgi:hypothetical protein